MQTFMDIGLDAFDDMNTRLNSFEFSCHSKNPPFHYHTTAQHLNTRFVLYLDPHCFWRLEIKLKFYGKGFA